MSYYSEVGVAMLQKDFNALLNLCKSREETDISYRYTLETLQNCDNYYKDKYENSTLITHEKHTLEIIILYWSCLQWRSDISNIIEQWIEEHGGAIGRVGEETEDISFEQYDLPDADYHTFYNVIEWYELVEPRRYIAIKDDLPIKIKTTNFNKFLEMIDDET